ncbi:monocarboxylate transporter 3, partial [Trichonephila clavata]
PLVSGLVNKYGCRIVSITGSLLAFVGFLLSLLVPQVEFLFLTIGLLGGVGFGLMYLPAVVSVALHFEKKRATAMGISLSGTGIGSLIMAPLTAWLISYYGYWKGALLILTGLIFNVVVLSCFYRQFGPVKEVLIPVAEVESASEDVLDTLGLPGDIFGPQPSRPLAQQRSSFLLRRPSVASNEPGLMHKTDIFFTGTKEASSTPSEVFQIASPTDRSSISTPRDSALASFRKAVAGMLGLSVLRNYAFLIFTVSTFMQYFGIMSPYVYIVHKAVEINVANESQASILLSIIGIFNTIGHLIFGMCADRVKFKIIYMYSTCFVVNGIAAMMTSLISQYYHIAFYSMIFGLSYGGCVCLASIVLVEIVGMEKLNNAYGIYLLATGSSTSIGTPVIGLLHDSYGNYDAGFYLNGGLVIMGALMLLVVPFVQKKFPE